MDTNEIIIKIKSLPMWEKRRIADAMKPFASASEHVLKLAELFSMLSDEEKIAFIELIKNTNHGC